MPQWVSESGFTKLRDCFERDSHLPSEVESDADLMRLFSDCYMCFYTYDETRVEMTENLISRLLS